VFSLQVVLKIGLNLSWFSYLKTRSVGNVVKMPHGKIYITALYQTIGNFKAPDYLLSPEENDKAENNGKVGSWYIRWGELHYINTKGKEVQGIQLTDPAEDYEAYKYPAEERFGTDCDWCDDDTDDEWDEEEEEK
jgi:hypothetical protein